MSRRRISLQLGLLGLLLLLLFGVGSFASTSTPTLLTTYRGDASGWNNAQKIVVGAEGTIHIVYQFSLVPAEKQDRFIWAHSVDGHTWERANYEGRWPAIGTDGDLIYITFIRRESEEDQLWLYRLGGDSLVKRLILSLEPHSLFYPAIAIRDGRVQLAWEAHRDGKSSIEYAQIGPSGRALIETVAEGVQGLYFPSLAVGPDGVHLVCEEEAGQGYHWIVHGWRGTESWEVEPVPAPELNAHYPALDYDPQRNIYELVFVGYSSSGNEIYYRALERGSWGGLKQLSRELKPGYWTFPTVEDGNVIWGRTVSAGCSIGPLYWSYLSDNGWNKPRRLEGEFAAFPHLFRRGNTLHLIWTDRDPASPIWRVIRYRQLQRP